MASGRTQSRSIWTFCGCEGVTGMMLEDKYRGMTDEEREEERRKLEAYEEAQQQRAGQYGGGMWGED